MFLLTCCPSVDPELQFCRPHYRPEEGWDDLEALQQVTLGDMMEERLAAYGDGQASVVSVETAGITGYPYCARA